MVMRVSIFMLDLILLRGNLLEGGRASHFLLCILPLTLFDASMELIIGLVEQIMVAYILVNYTLTGQVIDFGVFLQYLV